ncbi:MAG TPA: class II aldolase/adducin family protein [Spirochaetota bacterium]|nr:class II aldolase/adducin family protein [Spirochaetota bacterium]HPP50439.1 class II aldolase/adducin family protein [Spirochaetota bacterium]
MSQYTMYKEQILQWCQWLNEHGFFGTQLGSGGNISCRIENEEKIAVTPSSLPYKDMTTSDICIVDYNQNVIEGKKPTMELSMHLAIYKARDDISAVVHTHQIYASILSVMNIDKPISAMFDEIAFAIGDEVAFVPYALSGTPELASNVASAVTNKCKCYIIKNHGAIALGKNLEQACLHAEMLEKVSMVYYYSLAAGKEASSLPEPIMQVIRQLFGK